MKRYLASFPTRRVALQQTYGQVAADQAITRLAGAGYIRPQAGVWVLTEVGEEAARGYIPSSRKPNFIVGEDGSDPGLDSNTGG